jgi:hypothetical protein
VAVVESIELVRPPWVKDDNWGFTPLVRVRVFEAIKGVQEGQLLVVDTGGTNCDQGFQQNRFEKGRFFVAGQFEVSGYGDIVFRGKWSAGVAIGATGDPVRVRPIKEPRDPR